MVDTVEIPALDERQFAKGAATGRAKVAFDDRGNAVWQFAPEGLYNGEEQPSSTRSLRTPELGLIDDDPPATTTLQPNRKGLRVGYNPYESGQLERKAKRKPHDMRELSRWIELKRKLDGK